ncbi:MAG: hypothetical protein AAGB14_04085, partial [Verrucomicrobiota bacterium]
PTKEATIDSAAATGLRSEITAIPPTSIRIAKNQKRGSGIIEEETFCQGRDLTAQILAMVAKMMRSPIAQSSFDGKNR